MFGKKKKSNSYLYAGIKNRTEETVDPQKIPEVKALIKRKLVVSIVSLKSGVGTSHSGIAIANYLSRTGKEKACFLHTGCGYVEGVLDENVDSIFYPCNMSDVYSNYGYIVYDGGMMSEVDNNLLDRSDIKIMMCWLNDEYINMLAEFIKSKNKNEINNWVFLFNNVPDKKHNQVYALMEDYSFCCLPVFDASHINKKVKMIFDKIFYDRR